MSSIQSTQSFYFIQSTQSFYFVHCDIWGPHKIESSFGAHYFLTNVDDYSFFTWGFLMKFKFETQELLKKSSMSTLNSIVKSNLVSAPICSWHFFGAKLIPKTPQQNNVY